jgi:hypothetical protein
MGSPARDNVSNETQIDEKGCDPRNLALRIQESFAGRGRPLRGGVCGDGAPGAGDVVVAVEDAFANEPLSK